MGAKDRSTFQLGFRYKSKQKKADGEPSLPINLIFMNSRRSNGYHQSNFDKLNFLFPDFKHDAMKFKKLKGKNSSPAFIRINKTSFHNYFPARHLMLIY